jgi:hypothetical protein
MEFGSKIVVEGQQFGQKVSFAVSVDCDIVEKVGSQSTGPP